MIRCHLFLLFFFTFHLLPSYSFSQGEFQSNDAGNLKPTDSIYLEAMTRWKQSASKNKLASMQDGATYDSLAAKCIFTLLNNRQGPAGGLKHEGVFPSIDGFPGFWAWDSWKHAFALASIHPELAKNSIRAMFDYQDKHGMIADCIFIDTTENNWRDTKPPLAGWALLEIVCQTGDTSFVLEMLPDLIRYHRWWYKHRDHDQNGLCEYGSTDGTLQAAKWESGWDNAVRFDSARMIKNNPYAWSMSQESADLNAYLYVEKRCLAEMAKMTGDELLSRKMDQEAALLGKMIREMMWDEETGFFYDIELNSKQPIRVLEPNGWIPLWAGIASRHQASGIRHHMMNTEEFNTYFPFPTVAANEPRFSPEKGYWRGPVWLDHAYFAIHGLRNYGFINDADSLTLKLFHHGEGILDPQAPIRENYHPLTGEGLNANYFSWSSVAILLMIREYGFGL